MDGARKKLRNSENVLANSGTAMKDVFVSDSLTAERSRLLRKLKQDSRIKKAFTAGGKIKVVTDIGGRERLVTIDSLTDVEKLNWSEEELLNLGIFDPVGHPRKLDA